MEGKHIVTVDLGTRKLGISVCRIDKFDKPEVISYDEYPSKGITHGKVMNSTRLSEVIKDSIEKTENFLGLKVTGVLVNLQKFDIHELDLSCQSDVASGMGITSEDVKNLAQKAWEEAQGLSEGEEVFGLVAQCFETEDELGVGANDVVGMISSTLRGKYKVYLGKASMRKSIEAAFNQAGINNVKTVFVPDKVGKAVLSDTQMEGGVALMDLGAGASSVSIFYGGTMRHYGAVPFGGDSVTSDIRNLCGIGENLAENIKMGYGGCMPDRLGSLGEMTLKIGDAHSGGKIEITTKYLSEIITARMTEIIEALLYEIQLSGYADKLKNGIVIVGGGANMMNVCQLVRQLSGYSAVIGAPSKNALKASTVFFHPGAAASGGLVLDYTPENCAPCSPAIQVPPEMEKPMDELFGGAEVETVKKDPETKHAPTQKKEKTTKRFTNFFHDTLFGEETEQDNKL